MWRSIFIITLFKICFLRGVVCRGSVLFWLFVQLLTVLLSSKKTSLKSKKYYLSNNHLCPLFKYRPFLKRKKLMSPSVLKKNCSESSYENVCSGIYFLSNCKGGICNFSKNVLSSACQLFSLVESIFYQTEKVE